MALCFRKIPYCCFASSFCILASCCMHRSYIRLMDCHRIGSEQTASFAIGCYMAVRKSYGTRCHGNCSSNMGSKQIVEQKHDASQEWTLSLHAFADMTSVSPIVFLYLLKACYFSGTLKATAKFRALQHQVHQVLSNSPQPGAATFVLHCLYALPTLGNHSEGFSHLLISGLRRLLKSDPADSVVAKDLAAQLFIDILGGTVNHDEKVALKVVEVFDVRQIDLENVFRWGTRGLGYESVPAMLEQYIFKFIESQSYMIAVSLLEHFSIRSSGQSFMLTMLENNQFMAAEKWAKFMGKPMLSTLVQEYVNRKKLKNVYQIIKDNNLQGELPDVYYLCKESALKNLAEKGCWDIAEIKTKGDKQLIEYLVCLAMEAGYAEKVDELCDRFSLQGFPKLKETNATVHHHRYLNLTELAVEEVIWVDGTLGLRGATSHIEKSKVVGMDCEWKPNYEKGNEPNKVSIMQLSSEKTVFIFDLLRLSTDVPDILDNCLKRILQSPRILKLGYNIQGDMRQLASSYKEFECFKHYDMLLDLQTVFKQANGGLSALAQKILGAGLNKTVRNSNWEQRPLTPNQLEYAALDAAVLLPIFSHVRDLSLPVTGVNEKLEWKSHIISHNHSTKKSKKGSRNNKRQTSEAIED